MKKIGFFLFFLLLPCATKAQTLNDLGPLHPTPGSSDISQFSTNGNQTFPDGLNYYTDNQSVHGAGEPGQTFTTGTNAAGYILSSLALRTAGLNSDSGIDTPQPYDLHIYSLSGDSVTPLQTNLSANITFNDGDWLQWSGLSLPLLANTTYGWSFGRVNSSAGWEGLAVAGNNPYAGGEIGLFPTGGGAVTFGGSHSFDAVFDIGLSPAEIPSINQIVVSPTNAVFAGTPVIFTANVSGASPLSVQWQFNNGGGYANIPGANTNVLAFTAAITNTGAYQLILTNAYGAVTSAPVALSVTLDTNPPVILSGYNLGASNVEVDFSKSLDPAAATNLANYAFTDGLGIFGASLAADDMSVVLSVAPLTYGSNYTLVVNGILDQALPPNIIAANTRVSFATSPRRRILLDTGWRFQLGDPSDVTTNVTVYQEIPDLTKLEDSGTDNEYTGPNSETNLMTLRPDPVATHAGENVSFVETNYNDSSWRQLNLPHDWAVELPFDSSADEGHGFKPVGNPGFGANNIGWYRHTFTVPAHYAGQSFWLEFDGIYRNALIWLNGRCIGRDVSGYAPIAFDVTSNVIAGATNVLVVRVDASRFEGWFYEGAGIYRHVWLTQENPLHIAQWGPDVATTSLVGSNAIITIQTSITNQSATATAQASLTSTILDAQSNAVRSATSDFTLAAGQFLTVTQVVTLDNANLWSLQTPYLYNLASVISNQDAIADIYNTTFGVRMVQFSPTGGVFINGQHVEIQGMCNHQDHAGVGTALPDRLNYFRIERLKEMGCNAIRTSHNAPTPALLDACDRLGMLVLEETRRCGDDPESLGQLQRMVMRDRNHPCIFCWSLANEEWWVQGDTNGNTVMTAEQTLVHSLDSTRQCTAAINGSYGTVGFIAINDVKGFNYNMSSLDAYHASDPGSNILGTETSSLVSDRGIYTNDTVNGYVWGYDVENANVGWGSPAEVWWPYYDSRPWASGGFSWTGFDYRGEPTPYGWPCISSHFGSMDACGFPKDNFYYYQANWTLKPVLHLFPHWNWSTPGQPINIWAFGNCQAVELFVNGASQGRQNLNIQGHVEWDNVPYAPGMIRAVGYNNGEAAITNTIVTTGAPAAVALVPDRNTILADGRDVSVVTVEILDAQGNVVPTASNLVTFTVGNGSIIGVGNGDPSSHEADKASRRSVFNGLAEVIVQSTTQPGALVLTAASSGLLSASTNIITAMTLPPPAAPTGVAAVGGNGQVAVSWDIVPGASTYNLWRSTTEGGPYTLIAANIGGVNLGVTDNDVTNLTTYYYVVTANGANGNGTSGDSTEVSATPAPVVTDLTAAVTNGEIVLNWTGPPGAQYNVKRGTATGGPYETIASAISPANYTDPNVVSCDSYYYVVTITNSGFESRPSNEAEAEGPGALPPGFTNADIGPVGIPGSASYCNGQFAITGSGSDIWGTTDAFQFVYTYLPVSTNCDIRAQVLDVENTSANAKAALMIRETLTQDSSHAMADVEPGAGIEFIWRDGADNSAASSVVSGAPPCWIRLTRTNNTFAAYLSPDGNSWTEIGSPTNINMAIGAYVGLAACAHNNAALCTSLIGNLSASFIPANTPPILNTATNWTVNVGQTAGFTAIATDTNYPPRTLIFNLQQAPAGATLTQINNTNAIFNWRPEASNANSENLITLSVTDNGVPELSATRNFEVVVNPLTPPNLSMAPLTGGRLTLKVTGESGPDYAAEVSTNLFGWTTLLITNSPAMPWSLTITNQTMSLPQFYRIKVGPPLP
ncbi:MAG: beta-galactosidase GalA [Limisphaerales bacterium]